MVRSCRLQVIFSAIFVLFFPAVVAAAANPFSDVPADSWAYKAVAQLAKDGIIDGYPDGTFKGDRSMSRYEMAQIVYNAIQREDKANAEQRALIDKLGAEFVNELMNVGAKIDKLDKQISERVYMTGQATIRYDNYDIGEHYLGSMRMSSRNSGKLVFTIGPLNVGAANFGQNNSEKMLRTELYVNGRINGDWTYFASLRNDKWFGGVDQVQNSGGEPDDPGNNYTQFRQAYVQGKLLGVGLAVGRQNNTPAYGFVASEDMTGIKMFGGGDVVRWEGFWGNTDKLNNWPLFFTYPNGVDGVFGVPFIGWYDYVYISSWADGWSSIPVSWWDVAASARLSDKWNVKAAWMGARSEPGTLGGTETYDSQGKFSVSNYMMNSFYAGGTSFRTNMNFVEIGTDWTFDEMWRLTGVYSQSVAGVQNTAYSVQLDCNKADINVPGSWHAYLAYRNVQALAGWDSIYSDLPGYNGCGNSWDSNDAMPNIFGARGWEIGFDYVWDRNVQLSLMYNAYSPTVSSVVNPLDGQPDGELDSTEAHIADIGGNNSHFQANFLFFF